MIAEALSELFGPTARGERQRSWWRSIPSRRPPIPHRSTRSPIPPAKFATRTPLFDGPFACPRQPPPLFRRPKPIISLCCMYQPFRRARTFSPMQTQESFADVLLTSPLLFHPGTAIPALGKAVTCNWPGPDRHRQDRPLSVLPIRGQYIDPLRHEVFQALV